MWMKADATSFLSVITSGEKKLSCTLQHFKRLWVKTEVCCGNETAGKLILSSEIMKLQSSTHTRSFWFVHIIMYIFKKCYLLAVESRRPEHTWSTFSPVTFTPIVLYTIQIEKTFTCSWVHKQLIIQISSHLITSVQAISNITEY